MSLVGFEGFDDSLAGFPDEPLGTGPGNYTGVLGHWFAVAGGATKQPGLLGGSAWQPQSNGTYYCWFNNNYTRLITGVRFRTTGTFLNTDLFWYGDGTDNNATAGQTAQIGFGINGSGKLIAWTPNGSTVVATGTTTMVANTWNYLEVDVTFATGTGGSVTGRLNGSSEFSASSINTAPSSNARCNMWGFTAVLANNMLNYYDDMYLLDPTTGSPPYTSFLGICRVETLFPTSNNSVTWTPLSSTNVSQVQEVNFDSDTTYNTTAATNQDTFNHGALSSTPATIYGAAVRSVVRKDDVSPVTFNTTLISGGTTQQGVANNQVTGYLANRDIYTTDPNTSAAWNATGINNSKIGYKRN